MITTPPTRAAVCIVLLLLAACGSSPACPQPPPTVSFGPDGDTAGLLHVGVADTPASLARGLMGRRRLAADRGMLFLFPSATTASFWMKDTLIPLSIAFYDSRHRIVDIQEMAPCHAARCRRYRSPRPYVGAVEANRGYFRRHGIRTGDRVQARIAAACQ